MSRAKGRLGFDAEEEKCTVFSPCCAEAGIEVGAKMPRKGRLKRKSGRR